ncbi:MAG: hypothetical protein V4686_02790 [Patescibacteria group bacterium]
MSSTTEFEKEFSKKEIERIEKVHSAPGFSPMQYLVVFVVTVGLFLSAFGLSNYLSDRKLDKVKYIQDDIAIDILSSETQFELLQDISCKDAGASVLSSELNDLARRIEYSEQSIQNIEEVTRLKKYYSVLQVKDYILMKKATERCGLKSVFVLYFYTTEKNCVECARQGYVLTELRDKYPDLRVYSFDYGLDLGIIQTLIRTYKLSDTELPTLIVEGDVLTGYHDLEATEALLPEKFRKEQAELMNAKVATSTASTSKKN